MSKQNVYSKAGTIILQERMRVTPTLVGRTLEKKTSRWVCNSSIPYDEPELT